MSREIEELRKWGVMHSAYGGVLPLDYIERLEADVKRLADSGDEANQLYLKMSAECNRLEAQEQSLLLLADTYKAERDTARHEIGLYQQTHLEDMAAIDELRTDFDKLKSLLESAVRCNNTFITHIAELTAERDKYKAALERIRDATGAIPKDWQKFALLELNGRIFDTAHIALQD